MSYEGRIRARCSICGVTATATYDDSLTAEHEVTAKLEHLDDDVHNIVPSLDGQRCHATLVSAESEQPIAIRVVE